MSPDLSCTPYEELSARGGNTQSCRGCKHGIARFLETASVEDPSVSPLADFVEATRLSTKPCAIEVRVPSSTGQCLHAPLRCKAPDIAFSEILPNDTSHQGSKLDMPSNAPSLSLCLVGTSGNDRSSFHCGLAAAATERSAKQDSGRFKLRWRHPCGFQTQAHGLQQPGRQGFFGEHVALAPKLNLGLLHAAPIPRTVGQPSHLPAAQRLNLWPKFNHAVRKRKEPACRAPRSSEGKRSRATPE